MGGASDRWACGHTFPARTEPAAVQVGLDEGRGDVRRHFDGSHGVREMVDAETADAGVELSEDRYEHREPITAGGVTRARS